VAHDVYSELADMFQRDGHFLAARTDPKLFLHELNLVICFDGQRALLAPGLAADQECGGRENRKVPSHDFFLINSK
jgi:hypothetical protein